MRGEMTDGANHEGPVLPGHLWHARRCGDDLRGGFPVGREVVLAAQVVVVHPGRVRLVDRQVDRRAVGGQSRPSHASRGLRTVRRRHGLPFLTAQPFAIRPDSPQTLSSRSRGAAGSWVYRLAQLTDCAVIEGAAAVCGSCTCPLVGQIGYLR